ncbi:hypothetical protein R1flu_018258 [Riccia fluitans]|uniref:Uncharacterized protein n=1 Tax=Riccia fluitans TaxID=41844 RepID=A0ABD1ZFB2_9MARC
MCPRLQTEGRVKFNQRKVKRLVVLGGVFNQEGFQRRGLHRDYTNAAFSQKYSLKSLERREVRISGGLLKVRVSEAVRGSSWEASTLESKPIKVP